MSVSVWRYVIKQMVHLSLGGPELSSSSVSSASIEAVPSGFAVSRTRLDGRLLRSELRLMMRTAENTSAPSSVSEKDSELVLVESSQSDDELELESDVVQSLLLALMLNSTWAT